MLKIDQIDAKILRDLLNDANKSFADIAKETNLTKEAIAKRYQQMKKAGIIVGATLQLNYKNLGYNAVADLTVKVDPQQGSQVAEYIRKLPHIYAAFQYDDLKNYVGVVATLKDLKELDHVKDAIKRHKAVTDLRTNIWTDIKNIPENLTIIDTNKIEAKSKEEKARTKKTVRKTDKPIDETDLKIVEKLAENSRESFRKIAKTIGTSTDTVARRYKKLTENGTIRAVIQINPLKIGYVACVSFKVAFMSENNSHSNVEKLTQIPDLFLIIKTSGNYDMTVFVMAKDLKQLLSAQKEIIRIPGITRFETNIAETQPIWPGPREYTSTF